MNLISSLSSLVHDNYTPLLHVMPNPTILISIQKKKQNTKFPKPKVYSSLLQFSFTEVN